jgi:hypothetical protein
MLDEYQGEVGPIITTALWGQDADLIAADPWESFLEHGGHLIEYELLDPEAAIAAWAAYYELDSPAEDVLQALYSRRLGGTDLPVLISVDEWSILIRHGMSGIEASRELFAAVGFSWSDGADGLSQISGVIAS